MRKHLFKLLLLVLGAAISIVLVVHYGVHKIVFAWFWSFEDTLILFGKNFFSRRVARPIWNLLTRLAIIRFLGFDRWGAYHRRVFAPIKRCREDFRAQSLMYRGLEGCIGLAMIIALGYAAFRWLAVLPVVIVWIVIKCCYWVADQVFDQASYYLHPRYWKNRIIHRTPFLWKHLRPLRHVTAIIEKVLKSSRQKHGHSKEQEKDQP